MEYLISLVLVILSGLFSGLTLGLLSLDAQSLRRQANHGDKNAAIIYPIRAKGNLLLTTLLLGNVAVNTTLSIFLGSIASGLVAGLTATALIVVFGEIIPQAVISRYALWFGAKTIWFTKAVILVAFPIAYPIAKLLDYFLGSELPTTYSKHELMDIISEHEDSEHSAIDEDEERIMHGALRFSHIKVREVMTVAENVISYDENQRLTENFLEEIKNSGMSRLPIYSGEQANIIGILYVKDLIVEDDLISIKETEEALERKFMTVGAGDMLDAVLGRMLKTRQHLAIVLNKNKRFVGVIALEDIIEEIIQQEIVDEDDVED
ncbi:MAG: CNNM domain-containing protein [Candidatus Pacebacteria bacterium]|nr:CNNM domain-containing protein [Candidatus Paceibacterota bacterium]